MPLVGRGKTNSAMIIPPEEGRVYNMAGGREAAPRERRQNRRRMVDGPFPRRSRLHDAVALRYHPKTDEQVYVLEGVPSVYADDAWHELGPGTLGVLPHGRTPKAIAVTSQFTS